MPELEIMPQETHPYNFMLYKIWHDRVVYRILQALCGCADTKTSGRSQSPLMLWSTYYMGVCALVTDTKQNKFDKTLGNLGYATSRRNEWIGWIAPVFSNHNIKTCSMGWTCPNPTFCPPATGKYGPVAEVMRCGLVFAV